MSGVSISESQVRRLAHEVGRELIDRRDREAVEHPRRKLPPRTDVTPEAVVVEVDGGRIRTRAAGAGPGVHEAQTKE
ncbi:MAG: LysR family transcriptional regulator, partial [Gemmataceae bacterium]